MPSWLATPLGSGQALKRHRLWGKVFFGAMVAASTTALASAQHIRSLFLLLTAVCSLYMAAFGYRSVFLKHLAWDAQWRWPTGWWPGWGWLCLGTRVTYGWRVGNVPVTVFGRIGAFTALRQLRGYAKAGQWAQNQWLLNHISGFMTSYIAAVSAFSVTSLRFIPFPYNFLWPTALGVSVVAWWQWRVRRRVATLVPAPGLFASPAPALHK